MKKLLLVICAGAFLSVFANANNADLFSYDQNQVTQELSQLQALENYVSANPDISLASLQTENNSLVANLNLAMNSIDGFALSGEPPLGISSFLWGCVFNLVGVAIVYFMTEQDKDETKKAFMGCLVSTGIWVVWEILWYAFVRTSWYY
jgi:hypothetical protein